MKTVKQLFILSILISFALSKAPFGLAQGVPFAHAAPEQKVYYFLHDHLGGISAVTDEEGNVVERRDYLPFGEDRIEEAEQTTDYGFTGKEKDPESELYYYGARYYDPFTGRFISPDPLLNALDNLSPQELQKFLENPQNLNPYNYVNNNPINNVDPNGESLKKLWGIVLALFTPDNAYAPDEILDQQIAQHLPPYKEKPDIVIRALLGAAGVSQIKKGSKMLSEGLEKASNITGKNLLETGATVGQIDYGIATATFGLTDIIRSLADKDAKDLTVVIIKNRIVDKGKQLINKWMNEKAKNPSSDQRQYNKEPIDSWQYRHREKPDKKIELKDGDE